MYISSLYLSNFRNVSEQNISFQKGINVLYGKNASGKTNALEAVYLFASGKSLRLSPERNFIRRGQEAAKLLLEYKSDKRAGESQMSYTFTHKEGKFMKYNGVPVLKTSEFLGLFRACVFTPDDLTIVKGSPEERRRFIDISLCQMSPRFIRYLNDYSSLKEQYPSSFSFGKITRP